MHVHFVTYDQKTSDPCFLTPTAVLAVTHGSMQMERYPRLAMTHEGMHALELRISDID